MPTQFVSFTISNYLADWDLLGKVNPISGRFNRPPGLSTGAVGSILSSMGATAKSASTKAPCAPPSSFSPRRLKFSFATGGSISIPFPIRASAVALATSLKAQLSADLGVITCIELIGEKWGRVDEELRPSGTTVTAGIDTRVATGSKNPVFTGAYLYTTDNSNTSVQTVRQNTNSVAIPALPFSPYAAAVNAALGTLLPKGCGGVGNVKPRHYTATLLTTDLINPVRQLIIPVAATASTAIRAAGVAIATIAQTMCLAYEGESDSRLGRLVP